MEFRQFYENPNGQVAFLLPSTLDQHQWPIKTHFIVKLADDLTVSSHLIPTGLIEYHAMIELGYQYVNLIDSLDDVMKWLHSVGITAEVAQRMLTIKGQLKSEH